MYRYSTFIVVLAILYVAFYRSSFNNKLDSEKISQKSESTEIITETSSNPDGDDSISGSFFERFISRVMVNALKTDEGKVFFSNLIQPMQNNISANELRFKISNSNFIEKIFKAETFENNPLTSPASSQKEGRNITENIAYCGLDVLIDYEIKTENDEIISESEKTIRIGSSSFPIGFDNVIIGMKEGQTRVAHIPPAYSIGSAYYEQNLVSNKLVQDEILKSKIYGKSFSVKILLKKVVSQLEIKKDEIKIFDDELILQMPFLCGQKILFKAVITSLYDGKTLYSSPQKQSYIIGDETYPFIFALGLSGKLPKGKRSIIAKAKYFYSIFSNKSNHFHFLDDIPKDQYLLLDLSSDL